MFVDLVWTPLDFRQSFPIADERFTATFSYRHLWKSLGKGNSPVFCFIYGVKLLISVWLLQQVKRQIVKMDFRATDLAETLCSG